MTWISRTWQKRPLILVGCATAIAAGLLWMSERSSDNPSTCYGSSARGELRGLSVDFMVPVRDRMGLPAELPTHPTNKYGYALEFENSGKLGDLQIDFEAIALHLAALRRSAVRRDVKIARVIFDQPLRQRLVTTRAWPEIKQLPYMTKPPWIRHDEHYHVDFETPCQPLTDLR